MRGRDSGNKCLAMIKRSRFKFKGDGPINSAELELGALTIIAGRNNSGKTHLTHTLYGFLWMIATGRLMHTPEMADRYTEHPIVTKEHFKTLHERGEVSFHFDPAAFSKVVSDFLDLAGKAYSQNLELVHNSTPNEFVGGGFSGELFPSELERLEPPRSVFPHHNYEIIKTRIDHEKGSSYDLTIRLRIGKKPDANYRSSGLGLMIEAILFSPLLPRPVMMSSERAGACLFYKELDYSKNQIIRELRNADRNNNKGFSGEFARYALPVRENINYARRLSKTARSTGFLARNGSPSILDRMEQITGGRYQLYLDEIRLASSSRDEGQSFNIPYHMCSSSSRELALLHYYLKHDAKKNDLLFIDDPEAHLDSRNQLLLARMIADCVGAGLHVVVSTHSEIILKEFNTLAMLNTPGFDKNGFLELHPEYQHQLGLGPKMIRAHICTSKTLKKCEWKPEGFDYSSIVASSYQAEVVANIRKFARSPKAPSSDGNTGVM